MKVTQLTVFLEKRSGRLAEVADVLGRAQLVIRGFSTTDADEYGIVRLIVSEPERAHAVLQEAGFTTSISHVLCIRVPEEAGGLAGVLDVLADEGVVVDHLYSISTMNICVATRDVDTAAELLRGRLTLLDDDEVACL